MSVKFIHTSDWQLGVTRHFLAPGPQDRWATARNDAIAALCNLATDEGCEFIVVAGDVFETNYVSRGTVLTAIEAMKGCRLPIFLLPGMRCMSAQSTNGPARRRIAEGRAVL
jgi:DNA repair exonuclease SbcCD nuclease subunit